MISLVIECHVMLNLGFHFKNVRVNNNMNGQILKNNMLFYFSQRISKKKKESKRQNRYWTVKYLKEKKKIQSNHDRLGILQSLELRSYMSPCRLHHLRLDQLTTTLGFWFKEEHNVDLQSTETLIFCNIGFNSYQDILQNSCNQPSFIL